MFSAAFRTLVLTGLAFCVSRGVIAAAQSDTIPAQTPLRIQVDHRYRAKKGERIEGRLMAPVYLFDHEVIPANARVEGVVLGTQPPEEKGQRTRALLNGDFSPQSVPLITFRALRLPDGQVLRMHTAVDERDATVVRMRSGGKRPSLIARAKDQLEERRHGAMETLHHPDLGDRLEKWVYGQLPWHPRMIWTGTEYDAQLTEPLVVPEAHPDPPLPVEQMRGGILTGVIDARLTTGLDSASARKGAPVRAIVTKPLLSRDGREVILPEGARMDGFVTLVQPARWFARNGKLRFTFRSVKFAGMAPAEVHGDLAAAEAAHGENTQIDQEGSAQATSGPGKYLAPMALGMMSAASYGDDAANPGNSGVISNGFGLVARVVAMSAANAAVVQGFAYFALGKSVWYRWIARGHEVTFPRDTRIEIALNRR